MLCCAQGSPVLLHCLGVTASTTPFTALLSPLDNQLCGP